VPATALLILTLAALLQGPIAKGIFLVGTILCFVLVTWFVALTPSEKAVMWTRGRASLAAE
jgi:hypothetical protein